MTVTPDTINPGTYAALGWKLFPCHYIIEGGHCSCGDLDCTSPGKHPRTRNGLKDATSDLDQLRAWYQANPHVNWGLATGAVSGVFVVDIDQSKGGYDSFDEFEQRYSDEPIPPTLRANTGGGGQHIFFDYPGTHVGNRVNWLPGVDIRGDGGYVILPPGNHVSGRLYSWRNWGSKTLSAPGYLLRAVAGGGGGGGSGVPLASSDELLAGIEEGSRDDMIFRAACRWRRQLGNNRAAVTLLVLEAARASNPPFPENEALAKVEQAFKQDHSDNDIFTDGDEADLIDDPIFRLTDMGNRDRFVRAYGDDFRYVEGIGWNTWTDIGWRKVSDELVRRRVEEVADIVRFDATRVADITTRNRFVRFANESESVGKINAVIALAKNHPRIFKTPDDFDSQAHLLACRNGMLDLRTGELRPFTREDLFTRNTGIVYEPGYRLEEWDRLLEEWTGGDVELQKYLQHAVGYTLTGSVSEECFFIISGPKQSGKSTFMSAVEAMMGRYADVTPAETFMQRFGREAPREEIVKFAGARLISTEELPEGQKFDDAFLKRITGGSTLNARYLYQESFSFMPQFKLWMATNHDPITSDSAMFRRIKRVPFPFTIPEGRKNRKLKPLLKDPEIGGKAVLAWAVQGAIEYYAAGSLETPASIAQSTGTYQAAQDSFAHFLNETYVLQPEGRISVAQAFKHWSEWCKDNNERPGRRPVFVDKLREKSIAVVTEADQNQYIVGLGLRLSGMTPFQ